MKEKRGSHGHFSFEDDPSFNDFTDEDWQEWQKNHHGLAVPPAICIGCLNKIESGECDIFDAIVQRDMILRGECAERIS